MDKLHEALDRAWKKIEGYCKKYAGVSSRDVQVRVSTDTYHWMEFGVTPNGQPYIVYGDHNNSPRSDSCEWYYHPYHKKGPEPRRHGRLEEIVKSWPKIKEKLEERFEVERRIFNFEP